MENTLNSLTIRGFKSIRELDNFELKNLNVFIGANGAGKSNLLSFFKMMDMLVDDNLADYVRINGGISNILYNGRKTTEEMSFLMNFGGRTYDFVIKPTGEERATLSTENLPDKFGGVIYHFHDTNYNAPMRGWEIVEDNERLRSDASNIAPYLLHLRERHPYEYKAILNACRVVMPYFNDFLLKELTFGKADEIRKVSLSWRTKDSDFPMQSYHFSDGSIRFICLVTALLQPNLPSLLIIDEPELGLHPEAICVLGGLIKSASERTQIIIATQSPSLIDQFDIEDIVVVNRKDDQSTFNRLNKDDFDVWLEEYSVGELWEKNVIQGGICYE
jgi:predicted ATPase